MRPASPPRSQPSLHAVCCHLLPSALQPSPAANGKAADSPCPAPLPACLPNCLPACLPAVLACRHAAAHRGAHDQAQPGAGAGSCSPHAGGGEVRRRQPPCPALVVPPGWPAVLTALLCVAILVCAGARSQTKMRHTHTHIHTHSLLPWSSPPSQVGPQQPRRRAVAGAAPAEPACQGDREVRLGLRWRRAGCWPGWLQTQARLHPCPAFPEGQRCDPTAVALAVAAGVQAAGGGVCWRHVAPHQRLRHHRRPAGGCLQGAGRQHRWESGRLAAALGVCVAMLRCC